MKAEDIRAFAQRLRGPVEMLKAEWWASHAGSGAHGTSLEAGHALLEHARRVQPSFPSAEYQAADLEHHIQLKNRIDRASTALVRR